MPNIVDGFKPFNFERDSENCAVGGGRGRRLDWLYTALHSFEKLREFVRISAPSFEKVTLPPQKVLNMG